MIKEVKVKKGLVIIIGIALVLVTIGAVGCDSYFGSGENEVASNISSQQNIGIWVNGVGEITVAPDVAILSLGVEAQTTTVAEAQQQAAEAMDAVTNVLDSSGIAKEDIQTQYYSIQPVWSWDDDKDRQILIGYRVTNTATVKVRDMEGIGSIIDAAVAAGGDYIRINSISFTVDEPEAYYEEIREKAMADAKAKAKQLAELGGVKLGKPTYINEYSSYTPPIVYRDLEVTEGASVTTGISPGEMDIQLTIQVVYSIN
jgi:uncharacterized protein YggE